MQPIKMVDLKGQYLRIREEVDTAIREVLEATEFIQGRQVKSFEQDLSEFLGGVHVISCGNGTDALQIGMMALDFRPGDEVIIPVHTYVATAEVIALLGLVPVFADVHEHHFTLDVAAIENLISRKTVAIVPVHLYGQCAAMEPILHLAEKYHIHVIEDAAQALGASHVFSNGSRQWAGTMGKIGTTSFFPSKNLGAFGDGGALFTKDAALAEKIRMIANHGQKEKYRHDLIGVNSRLDTLQAAILSVKLKHLDSFVQQRTAAADYYDARLGQLDFLQIPERAAYSTHVFHQYTIVVKDGLRDALKKYLFEKGIPSTIYYPIPLHLQKAYRSNATAGSFPVTERLAESVLSVPLHTELDTAQLSYICEAIKGFR
ncbi:MAG: DegT/DnrJ/EryC1/StrS family aminotransferase [Bacteroidetes bacterium]|nr:DegT/DnrJ/EryC1/StrS family aminotransferase [Bacteroidota bacterium]